MPEPLDPSIYAIGQQIVFFVFFLLFDIGCESPRAALEQYPGVGRGNLTRVPIRKIWGGDVTRLPTIDQIDIFFLSDKQKKQGMRAPEKKPWGPAPLDLPVQSAITFLTI